MSGTACPRCGGALDVQRNIVVDEPYLPTHPLRGAPLPRRRRTAAAVAFCGRCEYAAEVAPQAARQAPRRGNVKACAYCGGGTTARLRRGVCPACAAAGIEA